MAHMVNVLQPPPRPPWLDDSIYPFADHYLEIDGSRIHYVDEGNGPPIVFMHGNPTWSFLYRHIVLGLRERFRCIAIDYPGFGLSIAAPGFGFTPREHAEVVAAVIDVLHLNGYTMMVHDWGGPIGLAVASRQAKRVRALIVANTSLGSVSRNALALLFSTVLGGPLGALLIKRFNLLTTVAMRLAVRSKLSAREIGAYSQPYPTPASRQGMYVFPREILGSTDFLLEVKDGMAHLKDKAALLVWGVKDPIFGGVGRRRLMESYFSRYRTLLLSGAGHFVQEDAPQEIISAIHRWWDEEVASYSGSIHVQSPGGKYAS